MGTFDKETWDKIGTKLWDAATGTDKTAAKHLPVWRQISEALVQLHKGTKTDSVESPMRPSALLPPPLNNTRITEEDPSEEDPFDPGLINPDKEPNLFPPDDHLRGAMGSEPIHPSDCRGMGDQCRKEALARGGTDILQAFPVTYQGNQPRAWEALHYNAVKELRKSVKDYGLQSAYTMNLLTALGDRYVMTPHDWKMLLRLILSATQYTVFMTEYHDLATAKAMDNLGGNLNHIGVNELVGEGPRATPDVQAQMDRWCFEQVKDVVLRALRRVPDTAAPEASFSAITQAPGEPYIKFLDQLQNATERQVDNRAACDILMKQLALENANADCRKVLQSIKNANPTITDMIKAYQDIRTETHKISLLADVLLTQLTVGTVQKANCYNCGKPGHLKKDCETIKHSGRENRSVPTRPCPRCRKGLHWANECRSKFHADGRPLGGSANRKKSAKPRKTTTNTAPRKQNNSA
ncbi:PREDICTED: endogenous retrovirus group K member 8 Gag polyprotein-like [Calidris pugnax]|uniref:endogenous retrovirus group K member 8 Gag polyprotein-like n=1 Tax=Calidris pugnax TaxID=198806 RepID=UPI00071C8CD5|nr:PREDICTED: endogenous retrovirus group K member 8 Gag polyprotein-like [Calidris pugnax]